MQQSSRSETLLDNEVWNLYDNNHHRELTDYSHSSSFSSRCVTIVRLAHSPIVWGFDKSVNSTVRRSESLTQKHILKVYFKIISFSVIFIAIIYNPIQRRQNAFCLRKPYLGGWIMIISYYFGNLKTYKLMLFLLIYFFINSCYTWL